MPFAKHGAFCTSCKRIGSRCYRSKPFAVHFFEARKSRTVQPIGISDRFHVIFATMMATLLIYAIEAGSMGKDFLCWQRHLHAHVDKYNIIPNSKFWTPWISDNQVHCFIGNEIQKMEKPNIMSVQWISYRNPHLVASISVGRSLLQ